MNIILCSKPSPAAAEAKPTVTSGFSNAATTLQVTPVQGDRMLL
jgi:hypothetical protein